MESERITQRTRVIAPAVLALVGPFLLMSIYLLASRWPTDWSTGTFDYAALIVAAAVAPLCISRMPLKVSTRVVIAILITPVMVFVLFVFMFLFVGTIFDNWL